MAFSGSGAGTSGDPYQITSWAQLDEVRDDLTAHYLLMNDLGSGDTGYDTYASSSANSGAGWEPIGVVGNNFSGTFDGDNHSISGLFIDRSSTNFVGLCGSILNAEIKNTSLLSVDITGQSAVGALVGGVDGNAAVIENCHSSGSVEGTASIGGLAGRLSRSFTTDHVSFYKCSSSANVIATSDNAGGLIGLAFAAI